MQLNYTSLENPGLLRVLTLLQTHSTEYLSGQDLSDVLKISRVAVWKHIERIRDLGYTVESKQRLGYRLVAGSDALLPWEITSGLKTRLAGRRAYYFDTVDSTQDQALRMIGDPTNNGAVIAAAVQTAGRGRAGRRWASPGGGIWFSVIVPPGFNIPAVTLFPVAASLALSKALEKTMNVSPELKWPNDLTIHGKKIAGMLVDASIESNRVSSIVLGVGINFDIDAVLIEKEFESVPNFYGAASLGGKRGKTGAVKIVQAFMAELEKICDMLDAGKSGRIISEWTERSSTIGKYVEIDTPSGKIGGRAVRVDDDGALVLHDGSRVLAGDVTMSK